MPPPPTGLERTPSPIDGMVASQGATAFRSLLPDQRPPARAANPIRPAPALSIADITKMPMSIAADMEIAQMVVNRMEISRQARRDKWMIWNRVWDHYRGIYDIAGKESWQSHVFMPDTSKVVETVWANMYAALMQPDMPAEWEAIQPENGHRVSAINDIIHYDMVKSNFKTNFGSDFLRTLVMLGTSIGKMDYIKEYQDVMVKERATPSPVDGLLAQMGLPQSQDQRMYPKRMLVKDNAALSYRDLYDCYPEPYTHDFPSTKHWFIEKSKITNAELITGAQNQDPYYRLENVSLRLLESNIGTFSVNEDPEKQIIKRALNRIPVAMKYLDPDRPHELLEYWGPVPRGWLFPELMSDPIAKYEEVPAWIWVVDGQFCVRKRITPYRDGKPPYVRGHYIRIPTEWYGVGVAELMMGLQIEKNELRNTRIDNVNLILNKITAVLQDRVADWDRFVSEPGAIWTFTGLDDIKKALMPIEYPDVTKDAYLASKEIDQAEQEVTAATNVTVGVGGDAEDAGGNTFRGQLLNQQNANQRFMVYARILELGGLSDAYRMYYQRIYQFKDYDQIEAILGPQRMQGFQLIPPEQLDMIANLTPKGVMAVENKGIKLAQMAQFVQQFQGQPWLKTIEIAREELTAIGYSDPDRFVFSDQEVQIYVQQQQELMAHLQAMPQAPGAPGAPPPPGGPPGMPQRRPMGRVMNGQRHSPMGQPVAGGVPPRGVTQGQRPALPAIGPGASPIDLVGRPLG